MTAEGKVKFFVDFLTLGAPTVLFFEGLKAFVVSGC